MDRAACHEGDTTGSFSAVPRALMRACWSCRRMALDNIRQRLDLAFPGCATVAVDDAESRYTVRLRFPHTEDESVVPAAALQGTAVMPS